ncbi:LicD family protein [Moellerella wisconsensis]
MPNYKYIGEHQAQMLSLLKIFVNICHDHDIDYWLDGGSLLGLVRHDGNMIPWDDDIDICVPIYDYRRLLSKLKQYSVENGNTYLYYDSSNYISWSEYFCSSNYATLTGSGMMLPIKIDILPVKGIDVNELEVDLKRVKDVAYFKTNVDKVRYPFYKILSYNSLKKNFVNEMTYTLKNYDTYMDQHSDFVGDKYVIKGHGQYSPIKKIHSKYVFPLRTESFCGLKVKVPFDHQMYLVQSYGDNYLDLPPKEKQKSVNVFLTKINADYLKYLNKCKDDYYLHGFTSRFLPFGLKLAFNALKTKNMKILKIIIIDRLTRS